MCAQSSSLMNEARHRGARLLSESTGMGAGRVQGVLMEVRRLGTLERVCFLLLEQRSTALSVGRKTKLLA